MFHFQCENCGKPIMGRGKEIGRACTCPSCGDIRMVPESPETPTFWKRVLRGFILFLLIFVGWLAVVAIVVTFGHPVTEAGRHGPCLCLASWATLIYVFLVAGWLDYRRRKIRRRSKGIGGDIT